MVSGQYVSGYDGKPNLITELVIRRHVFFSA
jgi:hypothetical protein